MIVCVATDIAADRLFDYAVPSELETSVRPGCRVRVPFGGREADAYVIEIIPGTADKPVRRKPVESMELFDLPSAPPKLKSILSVDAEEHLSPKLIELSRWMANYYCAPFELALRCALPAAVRNRDMRAKEQLFVKVVNKKEEAGSSREEGGGEVLKFEPASLSATPHQGSAKVLKSGKEVKDVSSLTTRQKELLDNIRRVGGGWLQPLLREFSCTTGTLRKLEEKGFITIEPHQMRRDPLANRKVLPSKPLALNDEQSKALELIMGKMDRTDRMDSSNRSHPVVRPVLLYGVTGSGKTEVYLQAISRALENGKGAIVLVPEIALTPQTVQRFASRFGQRIAVLHSALSEGERFDEWHRIRKGEATVVVGPRSALFAPVQNLGIIIVDEEHEPSYKQDETPRYHARDVAVMRAYFEQCVVVLGTATPSMETWLNVQKGKYAVAHLTCRVANRPMPLVRVVDMRLSKAKLFSTELLDAIHLRLERGEQTILFLNRRGHSNSLICPTCGYAPSCDECSVSYTYHRSDNCLRCHICGGWEHVPDKCPSCQDPAFRYAGFGTQKVEDTLKRIFSRARILRMDADVTTRKSSHDEILGLFKSGHADILIGTQMIAKGLDFPNVTLVGVLSADMSLHIPDFRAGERTYQLLAQVSGRAGRDVLPGEVFVQTFTPEHPAIQAAASKEEAFSLFAEKELAEREAGEYPPYTHLVCLGFKGPSEERVKFVATTMARELKAKEKSDLSNFRTCELSNFRTSSAYPAPLAKAKGLFRYQVILRASTTRLMTQPLREVIEKIVIPKEVTFSIDVDAMNMG
jgi:primosomal protein N' (replication factor Y) (superfamily II helicase)